MKGSNRSMPSTRNPVAAATARAVAPFVAGRAMLVAGEDRFGHFAPEPRPAAEADAAGLAAHRAALDAATQLLYRAVPPGAERG